MSRGINTGGPAFPGIKIVSGDNYNPPKQFHMPGMGLRDYFAAKALQGFAAGLQPGDDLDALPALCYQMADAMLQARGQQ